jgi:Domain of Unknown Function with PDB structure (DUF3857)/Transglutaminase-like superfamily
MQMKNILILLLYTTFHTGLAADPKYPVSGIPADLLQNVDAVVRENKVTFTILSQNRAKYYSYFAITILKEQGNEFAEDDEFYDKLTKLTDFNGSVYDATGKLIKRLKNSEIRDQSVYDGSSLFTDDRLKRADLSQNVYPYTVVFEVEKEYKFLYFIPGFFVVPDERVSVQQASYQLIFPHELAPRYKTINVSTQPTVGLSDGKESLLWSFENVQPIKYERMGKGWAGVRPTIKAAPSHFEFEGYVGDMQTWEQYGKWVSSLNKGRDILPEATKAKVRQLTARLATPEEKTKAVYEFLQSKSRYVGIQLGIGGYQPFEASVVDQTGYGDCKALSNYTIALLAAVGVKAHYVLISAGDNPVDLDEKFPNSQFNHATVCVPNGKDTLWLECTSQTVPFAYAGLNTGDRRALAITENGGTIVRTPRYAEAVNLQTRTADVFVDAKGNAKTKVRTIYKGLQYENDNLNFILNHPYDDQKKWVQNNTQIPSFDINSFTMVNQKDKIPSAIVSLDLTLNRLATVSGKRLFITPNLMNRSAFAPEKTDQRKTNVVIKTGGIDFDTIQYHLPAEIYAEFLPQPISIKSRFGEYEATFTLDQGKVIYYRKFIIHKGEYPPESYNEFIEFFKSVNKADNMKLAFLNKT